MAGASTGRHLAHIVIGDPATEDQRPLSTLHSPPVSRHGGDMVVCPLSHVSSVAE